MFERTWKRASVQLALLYLLSAVALAQSRQGEVRFEVKDAAGLAVKASIAVSSSRDSLIQHLQTDDSGMLVLRHLDFASYSVAISSPGFANDARKINVS